MSETEILVEKQPPQGVFVCGDAGRVMNKVSDQSAPPDAARMPPRLLRRLPPRDGPLRRFCAAGSSRPQILPNPEPSTVNPEHRQPCTLNPQPVTRNPQPSPLTRCSQVAAAKVVKGLLEPFKS